MEYKADCTICSTMFSDMPVGTNSSSPDVQRSIDEPSWGLLSNKQTEIFTYINFVCLSSIIGLFGIVANIINITVFLKLGFTNTVNISFLGISISDLCCVLAMEWVCVCLNPRVDHAGVPWVSSELMYLTGAWPHIVCGRITSYITVYVTAERCLCTVAPLKVKLIITPMRTAIVICLIYLLNVLCLVPEYMTSYLDWRFFPETNRTLLSMHYTSDRPQVVGLVFFLSFFAGVLSFVAVIVFTAFLVVKLKRASQWRRKATSCQDQDGSMSDRDKKTVKMIVLIATVLIVCYTPGTMLTMTTVLEPAFSVGRRYSNLATGMWTIACVFQTINSSINILLYYTMSSKFREQFNALFDQCRKTKW